MNKEIIIEVQKYAEWGRPINQIVRALKQNSLHKSISLCVTEIYYWTEKAKACPYKEDITCDDNYDIVFVENKDFKLARIRAETWALLVQKLQKLQKSKDTST